MKYYSIINVCVQFFEKIKKAKNLTPIIIIVSIMQHKFMSSEKTNRIEKVDYVFIDCGYEDRFIKDNECIDSYQWRYENDEQDKNRDLSKLETLEECKDFFKKRGAIYLRCYGEDNFDSREVHKFIDDEKLIGEILSKVNNNGICFKVDDGLLSSAFDYVTHLQEYNHCACFDGLPFAMEHQVLSNGKIVLVLEYDTESG